MSRSYLVDAAATQRGPHSSNMNVYERPIFLQIKYILNLDGEINEQSFKKHMRLNLTWL